MGTIGTERWDYRDGEIDSVGTERRVVSIVCTEWRIMTGPRSGSDGDV